MKNFIFCAVIDLLLTYFTPMLNLFRCMCKNVKIPLGVILVNAPFLYSLKTSENQRLPILEDWRGTGYNVRVNCDVLFKYIIHNLLIVLFSLQIEERSIIFGFIAKILNIEWKDN